MFVRVLASFLLLSITASFNAYAANHAGNGIDYTYAEVRYVDVQGGDGIEVGGSYRINQDFYFIGSYQDLDLGPVSSEILELGGGFIYPHKTVDLAAEVTIIDADTGPASDSGFTLAAGGRSFISPEIELRGYVKHVDIFNNSDTFIVLGADYFLNSEISLGLTLDVGSDADEFTFGGRFYF